MVIITWYSRSYIFLIIEVLIIFSSIGPTFGAGADLLISSNCNSNVESYSNLPHTYDGDGASPSILMGDYNFTVMDYEVFTPLNISSKHSKSWYSIL